MATASLAGKRHAARRLSGQVVLSREPGIFRLGLAFSYTIWFRGRFNLGNGVITTSTLRPVGARAWAFGGKIK